MHNQWVEAASWRLAAELAHRHPDWTLHQTFPMDGHYDCLTLTLGEDVVVDINRHGGIHLPAVGDASSTGPLTHDRVWSQVAEADGLRSVLDHIDTVLGHRTPSRRLPRSTPEVLSYRVIAAVLAASLLDESAACVVSGGHPLGYPGGREALLADQPEVRAYPPGEVWILLREEMPLAHFAHGWVWTRNGERLNLPLRRGLGDSIQTLATTVLEATRTHGRADIPRVPAVTRIPVPGRPSVDELIQFAHTYNGYLRLAHTPERLWEVVQPVHAHLLARRSVPPWAGLDLARATLFYYARAAHHVGDVSPEDVSRWEVLVDHIRVLSGGHVPLADEDKTRDLDTAPPAAHELLPWGSDPDDQQRAQVVWHQLSDRARTLLAVLARQPGRRFPAAVLADRLDIPGGKYGVAGALAWPQRHSAKVHRDLPVHYEKGTPVEGAAYWMDETTAALFRRAAGAAPEGEQ